MKNMLSAFFVLVFLLLSPFKAQMITIYLIEYSGALINPLNGFMDNFGQTIKKNIVLLLATISNGMKLKIE